MTISEIKSYMKINKITYKKLSENSGIPISTLKEIFRGATLNPRIDTVNAILNALNLNTESNPQPNTVTLVGRGSGTKKVILSDEQMDMINAIIDTFDKNKKNKENI